jgi:hypothetical protein
LLHFKLEQYSCFEILKIILKLFYKYGSKSYFYLKAYLDISYISCQDLKEHAGQTLEGIENCLKEVAEKEGKCSENLHQVQHVREQAVEFKERVSGFFYP